MVRPHGVRLSDTQTLAFADEIASQMVQLFDLGNSGVIFLRDFTQVVAFTNFVIGSGSLRFGRGSLRRVTLDWSGGGNAIAGNVHGVVLQPEVVEIHQPVGVDVLSQITDFKVQVRAVRASGVAAESDDVTGVDHLSGVDEPAGKVGVVGLQAVVVADDDEVAIAAGVTAFGDAHLAVPGGGHRRAGGVAQIHAAVHAAVTPAVVGRLSEVGGMMVSIQHDGVARCGANVSVMDADDVEILVAAVAGHPVEIGEQHAVAMVHVVQRGQILIEIQLVAQRVFRDGGVDVSRIVHHTELEMVLLRVDMPA